MSPTRVGLICGSVQRNRFLKTGNLEFPAHGVHGGLSEKVTREELSYAIHLVL